MRAIQEELGVDEEVEDEIEVWRQQMADLELEDSVREKKKRKSTGLPRCNPPVQKVR